MIHGHLNYTAFSTTLTDVTFGVSASYVSKVRSRLRTLGDANPGPQHGHVPLRVAGQLDALREQIKARPDATLHELRSWLLQAH